MTNKNTKAELKEIIRKIALINAVSYKGKAQISSVTRKFFAEKPEFRQKAKEVVKLIKEVVDEVNRLSFEEQKRIVEEKWPESLIKKRVEEKRELPPLPNVEKYRVVVTRFSPNPDCVLHLGSARAIILCYEYAKMYNGKFILRFEDTDPRLKRSALMFYDAIKEDLLWLGCKWDEEYIQSDRIPIYYEHAEKLLEIGKAYICTCPKEEFRKRVLMKKPCPCRELPSEKQIERWNRMLDGTYKEGEAVVRIKTDLEHPNPAIRDWPALRIIDPEKHPHPRVGKKYRVWPLYNFACGIDDHLMGITHIIRGKEHLTNMERQKYMYQHFGWNYPEAIHYGRLKITGAVLSKSKIVQGIRQGVYRDWDDPRLATLRALRRRGITPEAIRKLMIEVGPKPSDVTLSWENLYAYNRKIVDPKANRYFYVNKPIQLSVRHVPKTYHVKLHLHPDHPERGYREFIVKPVGNQALFWVSAQDQSLFQKGKIIRLMELFNIKIEETTKYAVEAVFHSETYEEAKKERAPLIHWLPINEGIPCQIIMPDATIAEGIAEKTCKNLKPNTIIQFERFGFVRVDKINEKLVAYYTHR